MVVRWAGWVCAQGAGRELACRLARALGAADVHKSSGGGRLQVGMRLPLSHRPTPRPPQSRSDITNKHQLPRRSASLSRPAVPAALSPHRPANPAPPPPHHNEARCDHVPVRQVRLRLQGRTFVAARPPVSGGRRWGYRKQGWWPRSCCREPSRGRRGAGATATVGGGGLPTVAGGGGVCWRARCAPAGGPATNARHPLLGDWLPRPQRTPADTSGGGVLTLAVGTTGWRPRAGVLV